jgi:TRAP-type transport system small permease protein
MVEPWKKATFYYLEYIPEFIASLLLATVTLLVIVSVFFRYFLNDPISWSEELARIMFIWIAFIGAALGVKYHSHFSISTVAEKLPAKSKQFVSLFSTAVVIIISIIIIISGFQNTKVAFKQSFHLLQITVGWLHIIIPISAILMVVYGVVQLVQKIRNPEDRPTAKN